MIRPLLLLLAVTTFGAAPIHAADSATDRWDAPHAGNPILPGYYADPSLVSHEGRHFLYATLDP